jgi:hypothetical protein
MAWTPLVASYLSGRLSINTTCGKRALHPTPRTCGLGGGRPCHRLALYRTWQPMQNGFMESLNGRMGDELLNEALSFGLEHARLAIAEWAEDYNK